MIKRIIITIVGLLVVVGILGGIKGLQIERMIAQGKQFSPPPEPVTTAVARKETWESLLTTVGSLEAVQGVIVTAELSGKVERIGFEPGTKVKTGELLVQQDISAENAQLRAAEAGLTLAKIDLDRKSKLLAQKTISRSEYDNAEAQFKQAAAQADTIRAAVKKKTIRAPF
ncbi:MAG: efflux transporter periplasmic adaptor subunit, partial [Desulfobacterales bacterium]